MVLQKAPPLKQTTLRHDLGGSSSSPLRRTLDRTRRAATPPTTRAKTAPPKPQPLEPETPPGGSKAAGTATPTSAKGRVADTPTSTKGKEANTPTTVKASDTPISAGNPADTPTSVRVPGSPSRDKIWIRALGPDGQDQRCRIEKNISTTELRKVLKTRTGVPVPELELTVGSGVLNEGVFCPFADTMDPEAMVVHWKRVDRLKSLLEVRKLGDINGRGKFDRTSLHFAVLDGDPDIIRRIVDDKDREKDLLNVRDVFRDTPLMLASILGYYEVVELLIDRQADLSCQNLCGRTSLQMAAEHGHKKVVKALLQQDADLTRAPMVRGPMGMSHLSKSAPYLAELNERHQAKHRIKVYKLAQKKQPGFDLDF